MSAIDHYAVFGCPVAHSKSPEIHALFAEQMGETILYNKQHVEPGKFVECATAFFADGGKGLNVTLPFKQEAAAWVQILSERAQRAGAVNTIVLRANGDLEGDNTDGVGLVRDITVNLGWTIHNKRVLLLGAGGAARGVLGALLAEKPAQVVIANRTPEKTRTLAQEFSSNIPMHGCGFEDLVDQCFDIVINGTSASLAGELPSLSPALLLPDTCCYDMMYGASPTVFMQWCAANGAQHIADGLGMLVEQAAESFYLWRGKRPQTAPVIVNIRQSL